MVNRDQKSYDNSGNVVEVKNVTCINESAEIRVDGQKYKLRHVIVHEGKSTLEGHYRTYDAQEMRLFDDLPKPTFDTVTDFDMVVAKKTGYMYGYEKCER